MPLGSGTDRPASGGAFCTRAHISRFPLYGPPRTARSGFLLPARVRALGARGRPKKQSVTPVVGGWIRGQKRTRVRFIFLYFFIVFLNSPHPETPKNDKTKK
jgi:hypothetical protein